MRRAVSHRQLSFFSDPAWRLDITVIASLTSPSYSVVTNSNHLPCPLRKRSIVSETETRKYQPVDKKSRESADSRLRATLWRLPTPNKSE